MKHNGHKPRESYDMVAEEYASRLANELEHKPFDREVLTRFALHVRSLGRVADVGCGPGHVTSYLARQGVDVYGIDLSDGMVQQARLLHPGISFQQGDMKQLPIEDEALGGIVAFYSLLHIARREIVTVLREFWRVLKPQGLLLIAFHRGSEVRHLEEWWGKSVELDFLFFETSEMQTYLQEAGFVIVESTEREPYSDVEVETQRTYIMAVKATP